MAAGAVQSACCVFAFVRAWDVAGRVCLLLQLCLILRAVGVFACIFDVEECVGCVWVGDVMGWSDALV